MSYTATAFNHVSDAVQQAQGQARRRKSRSGRGGGTVLKSVGVADVTGSGADVQSIIERLEHGSALTRKQRLFSTAFVKAVARRRIAEKAVVKAAPSRFVAPVMKRAA